MQVVLPPLACSHRDLMTFLVALSHLPREVQGSVLDDATKQILEAIKTLSTEVGHA